MKILSIDPANMETGFVFMDGDKIIDNGKFENQKFFKWIVVNKSKIDLTVIEMPLIMGNSMHIRNTILFTGQLIQFLRMLKINYYSGMCRSTVTHAIIPKRIVIGDPELSNIKSNDVKIKVVMKRIHGHQLDLESNDEIQALALFHAYIIKEKEGKLDNDRYYNNFQFPIPVKKQRKNGKRNKRNIRTK